MEVFLNPDAWVALLTLTFLEIVLGIDNIIFISIATGKLPIEQRKKATKVGMFLAMFMRIGLLFGINLLIQMKEPWFHIDFSWFSAGVTGQSLILLGGGLFLIYKSTNEIREKVDEKGHEEKELGKAATKSFQNVLLQIIMIDLVFSFDSILTAVGMTNGVEGAIYIMITAVVISVLIMMQFAVPVGNFVNKHPSIQILGLSFLILIGFMLLTESAHLSDALIFGNHVTPVPKGYLYFAISFSLLVEVLNMKMTKKKK
ncbi:TerC family protein [Flavobacterium xinjiangense]|jgi:predicted tellurium resistance membrane protein TerC|uniref:Membrane protein TerC, possibly involved in tellurium resistance n=2 Tax=Flavobacterium TaxID=237 RepID=A0A1M7JRJ2_9FLAO|nr:TerC family protein [Flavobacterium xinjiangense]SHM55710.1 Membrane protein TerC, possibly involved in tellurium resistance [Flavobacterium xinjiangense]